MYRSRMNLLLGGLKKVQNATIGILSDTLDLADPLQTNERRFNGREKQQNECHCLEAQNRG